MSLCQFLRPILAVRGSSGTSILEIPRAHKKQGNMTQFKACLLTAVALQYILNSPQFKLGPGLENLVHLLYPKGSIMSLTTEEDHKRIGAALGETTSTTLPFGLIELAKAPYLQEKLRAEIHATVGSTRASSVAYNSMLLLNAFITVTVSVFDDDGSQQVPSVKL
ncbi:hypothetical protein B0H14DRAFT_3160856 [Mycena olivaceomarginata]|nr:hypothetical protein B0H14DRAFT_3160856 [Mycena olivaceomarginata]